MNSHLPKLTFFTFWIFLAASVATAESTFDQEIALLGELLEVKEGSVLADIGAGDGAYAIALASRFGEVGRIYATELDPENRESISDAMTEADLQSVVTVEAFPERTGLGTASCDGAFLRGVYHHIVDPEEFSQSLFDTIRSGGRLVIVDFPPTLWLSFWTPEGIPENRGGHGIKPHLVKAELEAAGFVAIQSIEKWPSTNFVTRNYAVVFERP